jgi:peptide/nickel transport system permease protein
VRLIAAALLFMLALGAGFTLLRSHAGYAVQDRDHIAEGRSQSHWAGTDDLGRDRLLRVSAALLLGLAGAVLASALATLLAVSVGLAAAFVHPAAARVLNYGVDFFLTLPWLFLLIMVRAALPLTMSPMRSAGITFLLLGLLGWPVFARINYTRARTIRNAAWLLQGRAAGLSTTRLAIRHVTPHLRPLMVSQFLIYIPACLAAEANLGAMGLGISEPLPSWGSMLLALGNSAVLSTTRWVYLPLAALVGVLLLFEMLVPREQT